MSSNKFHNRSSASEVIQGHDLTGYEIIVTGGSAGIGVETVRVLAKAGARVVVGARDLEKANKVLESVRKETGNEKIEIEKLDLSSLKSVNEFVRNFLSKNRPLNVLVNNAGLAPHSQRFTEDGFELAFGTNHIGHFVLTKGLLPALIQGAQATGRKSRVVTLSSFGHTRTDINYDDINFKTTPYNSLTVYGHSKTANALFALALAKLHAKDNILSYSVHPGGIMTELGREIPAEEAIKLKVVDENGVVNPVFKSVEQGAATTIYGVVSRELEDKNGAYLEDCGVSSTPPHPETFTGHTDYITDEANALKLWHFTEELLKNIN